MIKVKLLTKLLMICGLFICTGSTNSWSFFGAWKKEASKASQLDCTAPKAEAIFNAKKVKGDDLFSLVKSNESKKKGAICFRDTYCAKKMVSGSPLSRWKNKDKKIKQAVCENIGRIADCYESLGYRYLGQKAILSEKDQKKFCTKGIIDFEKSHKLTIKKQTSKTESQKKAVIAELKNKSKTASQKKAELKNKSKNTKQKAVKNHKKVSDNDNVIVDDQITNNDDLDNNMEAPVDEADQVENEDSFDDAATVENEDSVDDAATVENEDSVDEADQVEDEDQ